MKTTVSLVITALLTSTSLADTLWRQYGFNAAHTSYNDSETILNPSNVSHLTLLWTSDTFNAEATAPTLGPASVFVASDGRVGALKENRVCGAGCASHAQARDRKSTRLNSSHSQISYAVFCLKKKLKATND